MKRADYADALHDVQVALVAAQARAISEGTRILVLFEGRDAAGKDGAIKRLTEYLSPRQTRVVALPKPTEREAGQWWFQRYVAHLPAAGELVAFNRSWYNRAGVERVMGFSTPEQQEAFLRDVPAFEAMLVADGIRLVKLWLDISREEQAARLKARTTDPLKRFKVSPLDGEAQKRWDDYSRVRDEMLTRTHSEAAPWTVVATDHKKAARLAVIGAVLKALGDAEAAIAVSSAKVVFPFEIEALTDGRLSR